MTARVLVLGGTAEARALCERLAGDRRYEPVLSLAGRTSAPEIGDLAVRVGGFGGAAGLGEYLRREGFAAMVDATHPFASAISANAVRAATEAGCARIALVRPAWRAQESDDWRMVGDEAAAAALLPAGARAFLALGRQRLAAFASRPEVWFLVRTVDAPASPLMPVDHEVIVARAPFTHEREMRLFMDHRVSHVVARNSGGTADAKLEAARVLGLPVIMIERPPPPDGPLARDVDQVMRWLMSLHP